MRTRSLETLRREAATACKWRGHSMRWSAPFSYHSGRIAENVYVHGQAQDGVCRVCGMDVRVITRPSCNESEISGNALALTCEKPELPTLYYRETLTEIDEDGEGRAFSDWEYPQECPSDKIGRLFRYLQREYGRCTSRVYVDCRDGSGPAIAVGWHFEKRKERDRSRFSFYKREYEKTYLQGAWIHLYTYNENDEKYHSFELKDN